MQAQTVKTYPCPCCGYLVFGEAPGSYDICPICYWEDDISQLRFVDAGGANHVSLVEAQQNFATFGASESRFMTKVRQPVSSEERDPLWRPVAATEVHELPTPGYDYGSAYPLEPSALYYWRPHHLRRTP